MEALLMSLIIVAANEMGDKTQLLTLCLVTQFRRPLPIALGIFAATLVSNLVAVLLGDFIGGILSGRTLHVMLGGSFIAAAVWALIPEKKEECPPFSNAYGIFMTAFISFLLAEIGDKTQVAALILGARFHAPATVIMGTTLGMMAANVPVLCLSQKILEKVPLKLVRRLAGAAFAALGLYELAGLA